MHKTKHIFFIIFLFTLSLTIFQCNCKNSENLESQVTERPAAPGSLNASAVSYRRISLTWADNSSNETGFRIERALDNAGSSGTYSLVASVPANSTSCSNGDLTAETRYHYRICAYNSAGNSSYSNEVNAVTPEQTVPDTQIIADHTVVDLYADIPQEYIDEVKKMWLVIAGESHSAAYRAGLSNLAGSEPDYAVNVTESGTPEAYTTSHLRVSRATWGDVTHATGWIYSYGEEDWFTSVTAISRTKAGIAYCHANNLTISVFGLGWCWDNGIDAAGMTNYLTATQDYMDYCMDNNIPTKIIFTTGPVDGYSGDNAYLNYLRWQAVRDYVNANPDAILFDYADILCWDDNGVQTTSTYNGITFQTISPNSLEGSGTGHIGMNGAVRLAKAMWWMLARMAGWDGN
jgi:hypothetical protein